MTSSLTPHHDYAGATYGITSFTGTTVCDVTANAVQANHAALVNPSLLIPAKSDL